jgi:hypothetical protein
MAVWAKSGQNMVTSWATLCGTAARPQERDTLASDFLLSTPEEPLVPTSARRYLLALRPAVAEAVRDTLALVPEVSWILWAMVGDHARLVSLLSEGTDDIMLRVADQELALMDRLSEFAFEFRMAPEERLADFVEAGYSPVVESLIHADTPRA